MATASLTDNPWPRLTPEEVRRPGLRDRHPGRDVGVEEPVEMQPDPQPVRGRDGAVVRDLISHLMHEAGEPVTRRSRHSAQCGGIDPAGRRRRLATQETQEVGVVDSVDGDRRSRPVAACHCFLELGIRRAWRCRLPLDTGLDPLQERTHRGVAGRTLQRRVIAPGVHRPTIKAAPRGQRMPERLPEGARPRGPPGHKESIAADATPLPFPCRHVSEGDWPNRGCPRRRASELAAQAEMRERLQGTGE
jgi:hypothetical protein